MDTEVIKTALREGGVCSKPHIIDVERNTDTNTYHVRYGHELVFRGLRKAAAIAMWILMIVLPVFFLLMFSRGFRECLDRCWHGVKRVEERDITFLAYSKAETLLELSKQIQQEGASQGPAHWDYAVSQVRISMASPIN